MTHRGWAYYNTLDRKSYIWDTKEWNILAQDGVSIIWKGEYPTPPLNPQLNWAYYNILDGNSYIWNGIQWNLLAKAGRDGASGILLWLGSLSSVPENPSTGYAYYNTVIKASFIWDGDSWEVLARDGTNGIDGLSIIWKGALTTAPLNPVENWAYYNIQTLTSYIWDGNSWEILTQSLGGDTSVSVSIIWKGSLTSAPTAPQIGWMYYNSTLGKTYLWDGSSWNIVAQDGTSPSGFLIIWKGGLSAAPLNPEAGWAYYNTSLGKSYIWDGDSWELLSQDGEDGTGSSTGSGTNSGKFSILQNSIEKAYYEIPVINAGELASVQIEIKNTGSTTLFLVGSPIVEIENNGYPTSFSIDVSNTDTSIASGASTFFTVNYNPTSSEAKVAAKLIIRSSDQTKNPSVFYVYGTARAPGLYLVLSVNGTNYIEYPYVYNMSPQNSTYTISSVDFGNVVTGNTLSSTVVIQNISGYNVGTTLDLTGSPSIQVTGANPDCFTVTQPTLTNIAANGNTTASITFCPDSLGTKTATITIPNNSPEKPNLSFTVTGVGTANIYTANLSALNVDGETLNPIFNPDTTAYTVNVANNITSITIQGTKAKLEDTITGPVTLINLVEYVPQIATITVTTPSGTSKAYTVTVTRMGSWPKVYDGGEGDGDDRITCSQIDSQGNLYFIGYGYELVNHHSEYDWWIKKIDSSGTEIISNWNKKLDVSGSTSSSYDKPTNAVIDTNDNLYVSDGYYTLKFASDGTEDLGWHKATGGKLYLDSNNNVYMVTTSKTTKYNSSGTTLWTKAYGGSLAFDISDNVYVYSGSSLRKLTSLGAESWVKTLTGFTINSVVIDSESNVYAAGFGTNLIDAFSDKDVWIRKFNAAGNEVLTNWNKKLDWGHSDAEYAESIFCTTSYVYVTGTGNDLLNGASDSDGWIKQYTLAGDEIASGSYVQDSQIGLVGIDGDGNLLFNNGDTYLTYNESGVLLSSIKYGGYFTYNGYKYCILNGPNFLFDASGNMYVAGYGYNFVTPKSSYDWVIRKFGSDGKEL